MNIKTSYEGNKQEQNQEDQHDYVAQGHVDRKQGIYHKDGY